MILNNLVGHEKQRSYFSNLIKNQTLPHAIMLEGKYGVGKYTLSQVLAQAVLCEQKAGEACGTCRSCIKMSHKNHPDYMLIEPDGTQIKNAQIESFQEFINIKPYDGLYKVVIIKDADRMNASSQNRILKTLEEPPSHVVVILLTTNSETLLPTVISRCQVVKLNGLPEQVILDFLNEQTSHEQKEVIAKLADGSIGLALDYLSSEEFQQIQIHSEIVLQSIHDKDRPKLLEQLSYFSEQKDSIKKILDYMILWYRDILLFKQAKAKHLLIHSDAVEFIKKLARHLTVKKIIENIELIETTKRKLNQHAQYDLTLEVMLIKLLED